MSKCEICRDNIINHNHYGRNCVRKRNEIIAQLVKVCKRAKFLIQEGDDMFEGSMEAAVYGQKTLALLETAIAAAEGEA